MGKAFIGAWIQAIGTVISAIGNTPSNKIPSSLATDLDIIGNVLQATGNGLAADTEEDLSLNKVGSQIQAAGNSTVLIGLLFPLSSKRKIILNNQGNLLQALGSSAALGDDTEVFAILGNLLQAIGNSMQAIAGGQELRGRNADELNAIGNWIQAIGAILSALAVEEDA